jgi:hypothetical protein
MKFIYKAAVLTILLLTCFISNAQTSIADLKNPANNVDCKAKFARAKELYAKMYNSSSVVDYRKIRKDFYDKATKTPGKTQVEGATSCKEMTLLGIKNNIKKRVFLITKRHYVNGKIKIKPVRDLLKKIQNFMSICRQ